MRSFNRKAFILFLFLVFFDFFTLSNTFAGVVWYVDGEKASSGNGTNWVDAFKTIHEAVNASIDGDEIWVKAGVYQLSATIEVNKTLSLFGGFQGTEDNIDQRDWGKNVTTLDGQNSVSILKVDYDSYPYVTRHVIIDGFTITRGAGGLTLSDWGWSQSSTAISNCIFSENKGGIYIEDGGFTSIENCAFSRNTEGGGIYGGGAISIVSSHATINNCTFSENTAGSGGAIFSLFGSISVSKCGFSENRAGGGGAVYSHYDHRGAISDCIFYKNISGSYGGGVDLDMVGDYLVTNSAFIENVASSGGGISNFDSRGQIINCIFSGNKAKYGAGIHTDNWGPWFNPTITNCSFSLNVASEYGGGIHNGPNRDEDSPRITNCILWDNIAPIGKEIYNTGIASPIVTYSDIQGGYSGEGNIDADPLFVDPVNGDLHLKRGSPCIDAGVSNAPQLPATDFEGDLRIVGNGPDIGADEFVPPGMGMENLIIYISNLDLPKGIANGLVSKIEAARKSLDKGKAKTAINQLNSFVNEVEAQTGKKISDDEAEELIAKAQRIIDSI